MLARRSELKAMAELIRASEMQEKVEYASRYPKLDLTNSYSRYDDSMISNSSGTNDAEYRAKVQEAFRQRPTKKHSKGD